MRAATSVEQVSQAPDTAAAAADLEVQVVGVNHVVKDAVGHVLMVPAAAQQHKQQQQQRVSRGAKGCTASIPL
jgi:hypothetical protein